MYQTSLLLLWLLLFLWTTRWVHCFDPRIIGGQNVSINDYPYQVSIRLGNALVCGGSIISRSWMLTAAHCLQPYKNSGDLRRIKIRVASSYVNKDGVLITGIETVVIPSNYNPTTYDFDVALIKLPSPLQLTLDNEIIKLADSKSVVPDKTLAVVTGWGKTEDGLTSEKLKAVSVPVVNQNDCKKIFSNIRASITNNMLCAGTLSTGEDASDGDSGGPLVYNNVQIGIVSFGKSIPAPNYPGVYTRVSAVRDWIKKTANV